MQNFASVGTEGSEPVSHIGIQHAPEATVADQGNSIADTKSRIGTNIKVEFKQIENIIKYNKNKEKQMLCRHYRWARKNYRLQNQL